MNNMSRIFIERPIMTSLVMAALVIFGVFGYLTLPVSDLPNVDFPTIQVMANLPGADPDTMASGVAAVLENQFSTIAGIDNMSSSSTFGATNSSRWTAISTPRRRMCRRRFPPPRASCPNRCRSRPPSARSIPPTSR